MDGPEMNVAPPCECGCPDACWHGEPDGGRIYCCDSCLLFLEGPVRLETFGSIQDGRVTLTKVAPALGR